MRRRIPFLQKEGRPYSKTYWNHENATKHVNLRVCGKGGKYRDSQVPEIGAQFQKPTSETRMIAP
jgi:hypothetical protein